MKIRIIKRHKNIKINLNRKKNIFDSRLFCYAHIFSIRIHRMNRRKLNNGINEILFSSIQKRETVHIPNEQKSFVLMTKRRTNEAKTEVKRKRLSLKKRIHVNIYCEMMTYTWLLDPVSKRKIHSCIRTCVCLCVSFFLHQKIRSLSARCVFFSYDCQRENAYFDLFSECFL